MNSLFYFDQLPRMEYIRNDEELRTKLTELQSITTDPKADFGEVRSLLGYNVDYLLIYLESIQDDIQFNDRSYQNGDGLHLTIANPKNPEENASQFYILGFSIQEEDKINWQNKFIWYKDIDLEMRRLRETEFNWHHENGILSLEILIPWNELHPYHPWHNEFLLGFNICYVKADRGHGRQYYFMLEDDRMQSEQSYRKFKKMKCEKPVTKKIVFFSQLDRYNLKDNDELSIKLASYSDELLTENIFWRLYSGENTFIKGNLQELNINNGFSIIDIPIDKSDLRSDGYRLNLDIRDFSDDLFFTILPDISIDRLKNDINDLKISQGSKNTLEFMLQTIEAEISSQKWYNTAYNLRTKSIELLDIISKSENNDVIREKSGMMRRGFLSKIDNSVQPYSLYVPDGWDEKTKLPLIVFLHGSGQDDTALYNTSTIPEEGFIVLAPFARGTSHGYATKEAILDIIEAIDDVISNYPIDENNIILSGFSMGGYGVLNTWYNFQDRFRALALFSAHPDLANRFSISGHPNFLDYEYNKNLTSIDIYVFHGSLDMNCPFVLMNDFVEIIRANGANVKFVIEDNKGHEGPSKQNIEEYRLWLNSLINP